MFLPLVDTPMTTGRGTGTITTRKASDAILSGLKAGHLNIHVGKARFPPILDRLSPALVRKIMRGR